MQKRQLASNLVLLLFFIFVSVAALFSDIFKTPNKIESNVIEQAQLFTDQNLELTKTIMLKNKSGEYIFERDQSTSSLVWHMVSPKEISANSLFIEKLFISLTSIKVKKIYPDEKINVSNFSIDKPTSTLNLVDQNGKVITIVFGLMNTIDNSTYLKINGRKEIFHVEAPNVSLENATLLSLTESQIISIDIDMITAFKILPKNPKNSTSSLEINKRNEKWYDKDGSQLSNESTNAFLHELSSLRSSFIIENETKSQKRQISNLLKSSDYIVSITDNKNNTVRYNISPIIQEFSDIDLKNEEHFIVTVSNSNTSYIIKKEFQELFNRKSDSLKLVLIKNDAKEVESN
jgi:hypothetical protein